MSLRFMAAVRHLAQTKEQLESGQNYLGTTYCLAGSRIDGRLRNWRRNVTLNWSLLCRLTALVKSCCQI